MNGPAEPPDPSAATAAERPVHRAATGFEIDGIKVHPATALAPMEGITDRPFRRLITAQAKSLGVQLSASASALCFRGRCSAAKPARTSRDTSARPRLVRPRRRG